MFNTPILFLIFNRPDTTAEVFAKIREVKPKKLYISADGPRTNRADDIIKCQEARSIVNKIDWDCEVKTLFNKENKGCGKAVSDGIRWFFDNVSEGIILEDDCLPGDDFFKFCETMLDRYRSNEKVLHIGTNNFQFGRKWGNGDYYFSTFAHIWGWATWGRAWSKYEFDIANSESISDQSFKYAFKDNQAAKDYFINVFKKVANHEVDTWDYQWQHAIIKNNGLSICPNVNLVKNIGYREDATHTKLNEPEWNKNNIVGTIRTFRPPVDLIIEYEADKFSLQSIFGIKEAIELNLDVLQIRDKQYVKFFSILKSFLKSHTPSKSF